MAIARIYGNNTRGFGYKHVDEVCLGVNDQDRIQCVLDSMKATLSILELIGDFKFSAPLDLEGNSDASKKIIRLVCDGVITTSEAIPVIRLGNAYALHSFDLLIGGLVKSGTARAVGSKGIENIRGSFGVARILSPMESFEYGIHVNANATDGAVANHFYLDRIENPSYGIVVEAPSSNKAELNHFHGGWIVNPRTTGLWFKDQCPACLFEGDISAIHNGANCIIVDSPNQTLKLRELGWHGSAPNVAGVVYGGRYAHTTKFSYLYDLGPSLGGDATGGKPTFYFPETFQYSDRARHDRWAQSYGSFLGDWNVQTSTLTRDSAIYKLSRLALKITANGAWACATQNISGYAGYASKVVTLGAWCRASSGNDKDQVLSLDDGVSAADYSSAIPKDDAWHWVTVTHTVNAAPSYLRPEARANHSAVSDTDDVLRIDGEILVEGSFCPPTGIGPGGYRYQTIKSSTLDLSGAAADVVVYHAPSNYKLLGYKILYTEASSADAGVSIRVGRYRDGVALDDDYFDSTTSEVSKGVGYSLTVNQGDLTQSDGLEGDTITVGTAGGKVGTGEVIVWLYIHTRNPE